MSPLKTDAVPIRTLDSCRHNHKRKTHEREKVIARLQSCRLHAGASPAMARDAPSATDDTLRQPPGVTIDRYQRAEEVVYQATA